MSLKAANEYVKNLAIKHLDWRKLSIAVVKTGLKVMLMIFNFHVNRHKLWYRRTCFM
jgi:hypothetical protein